MPGPHRNRQREAVRLNATCEGCHPTQAAEWRGSHHQRSGLNPAYRHALAVEPSAFCRGCHVPEGDPRAASPGAIEALGVGCVTCHVTAPGEVLAAEAREPRATESPHPVRRSAEFAGSGACAGCHEFRFPAALGDDDERFMQTTIREHRRSSAAAKPCAGCHMVGRDGARSHAFAEVRDPAWLRAQLRAAAEREDDDVLITLQQTAPGHAFPSGDLFRRLEVGVEARGPDGRPRFQQRRYLTRHLDVVPGRPGRHLSLDNRVFDGPAVVEFSLPPEARGAPLRWWVSYQRVATAGTGREPEKAPVESACLLASGALP